MTATISNLEGIAHVVARMDWYCALTRHLLNKDNVVTADESLNSVLQQLEQKVVALYKAILLYQMKSVCSYYRHQGFNFLLQLANWDDGEGSLKSIETAEKALLDDWDKYDRVKAEKLS